MKRLFLTLISIAFLLLTASSQSRDKRLSKEHYQAQLAQFIIQEAQFTAKEAADFRVIFKEMQNKQRKTFEAMKDIWHKPGRGEKECAEAIRQKDKMDIELKNLQQQYHNKLLKVMPASKVFKAIIAEDKFHRQMLRKWSNKPKK
ncbi:hypothetical protein [Prevotella sp. P2-180]|uniref:hypothetical protein n=1 Tax=Prevotella sp. P2-180 TaxID=2024224 RepID=UPI000BD31E2B|nr:hypothetical protein [Prevotella sp. P2-180]OYP68351.1 hypothetical protein CIK98_03180 [Prevotella sp. P2-180]